MREALLRELRESLEAVPSAPGAEEPPSDGGRDEAASSTQLLEQGARLRLAVVRHKRAVLGRLRRDGTVDDLVALRLQTRLDVEELRLTGTDPFA